VAKESAITYKTPLASKKIDYDESKYYRC